MTDPLPSEDIIVSSDRSLKKLAWAIEASGGQFKLILARCNYVSLRSRLMERLQELCSVEIRIGSAVKRENWSSATWQKW